MLLTGRATVSFPPARAARRRRLRRRAGVAGAALGDRRSAAGADCRARAARWPATSTCCVAPGTAARRRGGAARVGRPAGPAARAARRRMPWEAERNGRLDLHRWRTRRRSITCRTTLRRGTDRSARRASGRPVRAGRAAARRARGRCRGLRCRWPRRGRTGGRSHSVIRSLQTESLWDVVGRYAGRAIAVAGWPAGRRAR